MGDLISAYERVRESSENASGWRRSTVVAALQSKGMYELGACREGNGKESASSHCSPWKQEYARGPY
jgi:hypothetical protein